MLTLEHQEPLGKNCSSPNVFVNLCSDFYRSLFFLATAPQKISSLFKIGNTGMVLFLLGHYLASRALLWADHVTRMTKNPALKRLMLTWVGEPRIAGRQEMFYGRSLERHLKHFGLAHVDGSALAFT